MDVLVDIAAGIGGYLFAFTCVYYRDIWINFKYTVRQLRNRNGK